MQDNTVYMHIYTCSKLIVNMSDYAGNKISI